MGCASFLPITGIAVDAAGSVYAADGLLRRVSSAGVATTLPSPAASSGNADDGIGTFAEFNNPVGIAIGQDNVLYVADSGNNEIRAVDAGGHVSTVAGTGACGALDGPAGSAQFSRPGGVVADAAGNLYVLDANNTSVRKISATGTVTTGARCGSSVDCWTASEVLGSGKRRRG